MLHALAVTCRNGGVQGQGCIGKCACSEMPCDAGDAKQADMLAQGSARLLHAGATGVFQHFERSVRAWYWHKSKRLKSR